MNDLITFQFDARAIKYGKMRFYFYEDAVDIINKCQKKQIKVLGFDAFKLSAKGIQPFMEFSRDYSSIEKYIAWNKAREDLKHFSGTDLVFEIIYE